MLVIHFHCPIIPSPSHIVYTRACSWKVLQTLTDKLCWLSNFLINDSTVVDQFFAKV